MIQSEVATSVARRAMVACLATVVLRTMAPHANETAFRFVRIMSESEPMARCRARACRRTSDGVSSGVVREEESLRSVRFREW